MIKCTSYNCNSIRNNVENVKMLHSISDVVFLQEIMLCKSDLSFLDCLDDNFEKVAFVNDREQEGIVEGGRPVRGVAIFLEKNFFCRYQYNNYR